MPFHSYATSADVAIAHRIRLREAEFVAPAPIALSDHFRADIEFTIRDSLYRVSEAAVCESLIYPVLREVWRPYVRDLTLWSHYPLSFDADLCGLPDYMISRRSPLGTSVPDQPFLVVLEAQKDDFDRGWGECLAAMRAAQHLSGCPELSFFGASTNGRVWEFGCLDGDEFVQDRRQYFVQELDDLAAAMHYVMLRCCDQAALLPVEA